MLHRAGRVVASGATADLLGAQGLLARAVLDLLRSITRTGPGRPAGALLAAAGRNLPATGADDHAAALTELADAGSPAWTPLLRRAAGAVAARRTFMEEIG